MAKDHTRRRRKGTIAIWFKRNWLLVCLAGLAIAGIVLSFMLLFTPCEKKTHYKYANITEIVNMSVPYNQTINRTINTTINQTTNVTRNVTTNYTTNATFNVTVNVTTNETVLVAYNVTVNGTVSFNVTVNATLNVSMNSTVNSTVNFTISTNVSTIRTINSTVNETTNVTSVYNVTQNASFVQPFEASLLMDASVSVDAANWLAQVDAAVSLINITHALLNTSSSDALQYGVLQWGCDAVESFALTPYAPVVLEKVAALQQKTQLQTINMIGLMDCYDQHEVGGSEGAFKICQYITDGAPSKDETVWVDENTTVKASDTLECYIPSKRAYGWCQRHGIQGNCSLWSVTDFLASAGFKIHYIVVGSGGDSSYDKGIIYQLSSCDTNWTNTKYFDFPYSAGGALGDSSEEGSYKFYKKGGVDSNGGTSICDSEHWPGFVCDEACGYVTEVDSYASIVAGAANIVSKIVAYLGSVTTTAEKTEFLTTAVTSQKRVPVQTTETETVQLMVAATVATTVATTTTTQTMETSTVEETTQSTSLQTQEVTSVSSHAISREVTSATVSSSTSTERAAVRTTSLERSTTKETVTASLESSSTVTNMAVLQDDYCVGSGLSLLFWLLALPLCVYLFFKPSANVIDHLLHPPSPTSSMEMNMNPFFGNDDASDADMDARPTLAPKNRTAVNMERHKAAARKKKKKNVGAAQEEGTAAWTEEDDTSSSMTEEDPPVAAAHVRPARRASRRASGVEIAFKGNSGDTDFDGLAAVYNGDQWQEDVVDFVIRVLNCACFKKRPVRGAPTDQAETSQDPL